MDAFGVASPPGEIGELPPRPAGPLSQQVDTPMALQLGAAAPDFEAQTTEGPIHFYVWLGDSRAVLLSHRSEPQSPPPTSL
jgi:hypothetical protein